MTRFVDTAEMNLLRRIVESEDGELVCSRPGGWWVGNEKVSGKIAMNLLRLALIRVEYNDSDSYVIYGVNQDGRRVLEDPDYEPMMLRAMRTGEPQFN
jgi:hypothetical protein